MFNKFLLVVLVIILICGPAYGYEMGYRMGYKILTKDGSTRRKAIIIEGNYGNRVVNENFQIGKTYGVRGISWTVRSRETVKSDLRGKIYDIVVIGLTGGGKVTFFFDITTPYIRQYGSVDVFAPAT